VISVDGKLERIRDLINTKERVDEELQQLLGGTELPRRGRPRKETNIGAGSERSAEAPERQGEASV
jgi:hypothetical protein